MLLSSLKLKIFGLIKKAAGISFLKDEQVSEVISCWQLIFSIFPFQNLIEANDKLAIDIEGQGRVEEERVEEIGKLQNQIKILLKKKSVLRAKVNALEHTI